MKRGRKPKGYVNLHLQLNQLDLDELKNRSEQRQITVNEQIRQAIALYLALVQNPHYWAWYLIQGLNAFPQGEISKMRITELAKKIDTLE